MQNLSRDFKNEHRKSNIFCTLKEYNGIKSFNTRIRSQQQRLLGKVSDVAAHPKQTNQQSPRDLSRDETPGGPTKNIDKLNLGINGVRMCVKSTHVYTCAGRQDEILD